MGQHNFEKEIAGKLRDREISPKAETWSKLSSQLENEDKKPMRMYWITGIAAALVAGFFILGQVYRTELNWDTPAVVDSPSEKIEKRKEIVQDPTQEVATEETKAHVPEEKEAPAQITSPVQERQELAAVEEDKIPEEAVVLPDAVIERQEEINSVKLEEVIANVSSRIEGKGELEESEVDALLYKAAAEISRERNNNRVVGQIDAEALLMDVEMELERSFRDKVFEVLKDGYLKARTAVANRNN